jgi:hypothetical protein
VADIRHSSYSVQMLADDISAGTEMCGWVSWDGGERWSSCSPHIKSSIQIESRPHIDSQVKHNWCNSQRAHQSIVT